jgi:hypothetical protein
LNGQNASTRQAAAWRGAANRGVSLGYRLRRPPGQAEAKPLLNQQRASKRARSSARQIFAELAISIGPARNAIRQPHFSGSPKNRVR